MSSSWTPDSRFRDKDWYIGKAMRSAVFALCLFALSACGQGNLFGGDETPPAPPSSAAPTVSESLPALQSPPGSEERPAPIGTTGTPRTPDGLPALQPPRGLNNSQLFEQKLSDPDLRISRLENAVQELRNDFDKMAPSIIRLIAIESDIQTLVKQLETLLNSEPPPQKAPTQEIAPTPLSSAGSSAPVALADEPAMEPDAPALESMASGAPVPITGQASPPAPSRPVLPAGKIAVLDMRVGEHPDKTRIVLDVSGKTSFRADLDKAERILLVELPETVWRAPASTRYPDSKLLVSHVAESTGDGPTLLIVQLKTDADLIYQGTMSGKDGKGQRIIIDLAADKGAATQ